MTSTSSRDTRSFARAPSGVRSEEHTSELQSRVDLVCRLLLEKKTAGWMLALMPERHRLTGEDRARRSEEHTSELQSHSDIVCRRLLEKTQNAVAEPAADHART